MDESPQASSPCDWQRRDDHNRGHAFYGVDGSWAGLPTVLSAISTSSPYLPSLSRWMVVGAEGLEPRPRPREGFALVRPETKCRPD